MVAPDERQIRMYANLIKQYPASQRTRGVAIKNHRVILCDRLFFACVLSQEQKPDYTRCALRLPFRRFCKNGPIVRRWPQGTLARESSKWHKKKQWRTVGEWYLLATVLRPMVVRAICSTGSGPQKANFPRPPYTTRANGSPWPWSSCMQVVPKCVPRQLYMLIDGDFLMFEFAIGGQEKTRTRCVHLTANCGLSDRLEQESEALEEEVYPCMIHHQHHDRFPVNAVAREGHHCIFISSCSTGRTGCVVSVVHDEI